MPRWLQVQLSVTLWAFWALVIVVGGSYALSRLTASGERPFTLDEKAYLEYTYPGGAFIAASTYKWCDQSGTFRYFDSRGDVWHHNESCWRR